jgi:hypothetical protein
MTAPLGNKPEIKKGQLKSVPLHCTGFLLPNRKNSRNKTPHYIPLLKTRQIRCPIDICSQGCSSMQA